MLSRRVLTLILSGFMLAWIWLVTVTTIFAHGSTKIGPYDLVVGWVNEPPIVGERNAILLIVTNEETGEPVSGVEASLNAEAVYGTKTFRANLNPTTIPGEYTLDIIPTIRGQYNLRLFGTIETLEVELIVEPEEVFAAARLQFPEPEPDSFVLQEQSISLENHLQQTRSLAFVGIGLGVLGLLVGIVGSFRKR